MTEYLMGIASGLLFRELYHWVVRPTVDAIKPVTESVNQNKVILPIGKYHTIAKGTSHYQKAFKDESGIVEVIVEHEDNNPHDNQAVRIMLNGKIAGYLSREDARTFRRERSYKSMLCQAKIVGGYDDKFYGLRLDI